MYDRLTQKDIEKMEQEIEHRKLVVRKHEPLLLLHLLKPASLLQASCAQFPAPFSLYLSV